MFSTVMEVTSYDISDSDGMSRSDMSHSVVCLGSMERPESHETVKMEAHRFMMTECVDAVEFDNGEFVFIYGNDRIIVFTRHPVRPHWNNGIVRYLIIVIGCKDRPVGDDVRQAWDDGWESVEKLAAAL